MNGLSMTYLEKFEGFKRQEIGCCAIRWIEEDDVLMFLTSDSCEEALWGGILGPFTRLLGTRSCFAFFGFAYYWMAEVNFWLGNSGVLCIQFPL